MFVELYNATISESANDLLNINASSIEPLKLLIGVEKLLAPMVRFSVIEQFEVLATL